MNNFLRLLRFAWPYRMRLAASIGCALAVALLWGANFTAIYPILKILGKDKQNLQQWINDKISFNEGQIDRYQKELEEDEKNKQRVEKDITRIEAAPLAHE